MDAPLASSGALAPADAPSSPPGAGMVEPLLSITHDCAALASMALEELRSWWADRLGAFLGRRGWGPAVEASPSGQWSGEGLAIVVVGAAEPIGQSLTIRLAQAGYTVFPLVPLASPSVPPATSPLSSILLAWSRAEKRLRRAAAGHGRPHPGAVVPIATDAAADDLKRARTAPAPGKRGRLAHTGETVHAYCRDNALALVAVVCVPSAEPNVAAPPPAPASPPTPAPVVQGGLQLAGVTAPAPTTGSMTLHGPSALVPVTRWPDVSEHDLLQMYRADVLDPLNAARELGDLLHAGGEQRGARARVVVLQGGGVNGHASGGRLVDEPLGRPSWAARVMGAARREVAGVLREELAGRSVDVCEVLVGAKTPPIPGTGHLRHGSADAGASSFVIAPDAALATLAPPLSEPSTDLSSQPAAPLSADIVQSQRTSAFSALVHMLALVHPRTLAPIFTPAGARFVARALAVDDELVYGAVRRAIEDRYARDTHHAGLAPLVRATLDAAPLGSGRVARWVGRRVLRLLFAHPMSGGDAQVGCS